MEPNRQHGIMALFFRIKYAEEKIKSYQRSKEEFEAALCDGEMHNQERLAESLRQELINMGATEELMADLEEFYNENELFKYMDNGKYYSTIA